MQTVDITFPNSSLIFQAIKPRPQAPAAFQEQLNLWKARHGRHGRPGVRLVTKDGSEYTWNLNGDVHVKRPDGAYEIYWAKPTMADAFCYDYYPRGFYQFHTDGAVTCRAYGASYFWAGKGSVGVAVDGRRCHGRFIDDGEQSGWFFNNDPDWYDDCDCRDCLGDYDTTCDYSDDDCHCGNAYRCCGYDPSDAYTRD